STSPVPRLMARSMLSLGIDTSRALSMAYRSLRFMVGSPPPCRAAMMIARLSLLHSLPRLASMAPFLCLIVAQCEWPDMVSSRYDRFDSRLLDLHATAWPVHRSQFTK